MDFLKLKQFGVDYDIVIDVDHYVEGDGLALQLYCVEGDFLEPYATLTVNLVNYPVKENCAFVDATYFPEAHDFIVNNKLGKPTGRVGRSGYCTYMEFQFDRNEIAKYEIRPESEKETTQKARDDAR